MTNVVVVHDYLTQRGGAERVALELLRAFPGAPLVTSAYVPHTTFPEFAEHEIRDLGLARFKPFGTDVRRAMPVLAPLFSAQRIEADVVVCSSSGWAHGVRSTGRKLVYCHTPARWLYLADEYLGATPSLLRTAALRALGPPLRRWDRRAALGADRYIANSTVVAGRIWATYGLLATVVAPPPAVTSAGERRPIAGLPERFALCVSRLLPYKHVLEAARGANEAGIPLVVVGSGPMAREVDGVLVPPSIRLECLTDSEMRWLYEQAAVVIAVAQEDLGLTPLEAAALGRPVVALRGGGYLDTVVEGVTGVFVDTPEPGSIALGVAEALGRPWDRAALRAHAESFAAERFRAAIAAEVESVLGA